MDGVREEENFFSQTRKRGKQKIERREGERHAHLTEKKNPYMDVHGGADPKRICRRIATAVTSTVFADVSAYGTLSGDERKEIRRKVSSACRERLGSDDLPERALSDIVRTTLREATKGHEPSDAEVRRLSVTVVKLLASDAHGLLPTPLCGMNLILGDDWSEETRKRVGVSMEGDGGGDGGGVGVGGLEHGTDAIAMELTAPIGFELFLPVTRTRRVLAGGGGRGLVHQLATQDAVTAYEKAERLDARKMDMFAWLAKYGGPTNKGGGRTTLTAMRLVSGVIWNDLPTGDASDPAYSVEKLDIQDASRAISAQAKRLGLSASSVTVEDRFAYNPSDAMLVRLIWVLAKSRLKLASDRDPIYQSHYGPHAVFHSMARTEAESAPSSRGTVLGAIAAVAVDWFTRAVEHADLFPLGHLLHMVQDAYASGHVERANDAKHSVVFFRYYGNQSSSFHHDNDSLKAYVTGRRARCTEVQLKLLYIYVDALRNAGSHHLSSYLTSLKTLLSTEIYPFHGPAKGRRG